MADTDYSSMTKEALIEEAESRGLDLPENAKASQIRDALKLNDNVSKTYEISFEGIDISIPGKRFNDFRLVKALRETQKNPLAVADVLSLLLGEDFDDVCDLLSDEDGYLPTEKMAKLMETIMKQSGSEAKNS